MPLVPCYRHDTPSYQDDIDTLCRMLRGGSLTSSEQTSGLDIPKIVREIIAEVERGRDQAVSALTSRLDRADITTDRLRVSAEELAEAHSLADPEYLALVRAARDNIRAYQEHIKIRAPEPLIRDGRSLGVRYTPIDRVGVYVPGGRALYPSTVLMTVVPAQVAGVREIVMVSPPTGGNIHPLALALAKELGIQEVFRVGGAVAIAALSVGTETIRAVQKIVGPGNAFVAEAKRQLFGRVGIDSVAGPSEVFIVADQTAPAQWIAADLMAQVEHDPGSAILATPSATLVTEVLAALEQQLGTLERSNAIRSALERYSAIILTRDLEEASELANRFATEHLQIMTSEDELCLARIRHAGAIFLGPHTPVPLGDYFAGPSHVLPTGGTAAFFGPLCCNDFLKSTSIVHYDAQALEADARFVENFAKREGLTAHANAVALRRHPRSP